MIPAAHLLACLVITAVPTTAEPFHFAYSASDGSFPDAAGMSRYWNDPNNVLRREITPTAFRLDSRSSASIFDLYLLQSSALALLPGERFELTWTMQTLEVSDDEFDLSDVAVTVTNSASQYIQFSLLPDRVTFDQDGGLGAEHVFALTPGMPHTYRLASADMLSFSLYVDSEFAFSGAFFSTAIIGPNIVAFGDTYFGLSSLAEWSSFEVTVVPELEPGTLIVLWLFCAARLRTWMEAA